MARTELYEESKVPLRPEWEEKGGHAALYESGLSGTRPHLVLLSRRLEHNTFELWDRSDSYSIYNTL